MLTLLQSQGSHWPPGVLRVRAGTNRKSGRALKSLREKIFSKEKEKPSNTQIHRYTEVDEISWMVINYGVAKNLP